jgi:hypothetical protein
VVWTPVPELFGLLAVIAAFGLACYRGTSQMQGASGFRKALPGIIAFFSWLFSMLVFTAMFGTHSRSKAEMTSLLLWFLAAIAYAWGRHLVALDKVPLTGGARAGRIALWVFAAIATLMAGANIISYA